MDPYHILGVSPNATPDEIKNAYRRLVKQFHPDKNSSEEAKEQVRLINAAYEILSDPVQRSHYHQPVYAGIETDEDPIEAYKTEFQRKRWEKAQAQKARKLARSSSGTRCGHMLMPLINPEQEFYKLFGPTLDRLRTEVSE